MFSTAMEFPAHDKPIAVLKSSIMLLSNQTKSITNNSEDQILTPATYDQIVVTFLVVISILIGLILNGAAIVLFLAYWRKLSRHMINWLMFNVALTNMITIACGSVALIVEEFTLVTEWRSIQEIFVIDEDIEHWKRNLMITLNIAFNVSAYSLVALSIERWTVISGRRKKAFSHELVWTAVILILIWVGSILHGFSRFFTFARNPFYHTLMAVVLYSIPCLLMAVFFVASGRRLLYKFGATDNFTTRYLKARTRTAQFLFFYVAIFQICLIPFMVLTVLYAIHPTCWYLRCEKFGQFITHLIFVMNNCVIQCISPSLIFMLSSIYRRCACNAMQSLRKSIVNQSTNDPYSYA